MSEGTYLNELEGSPTSRCKFLAGSAAALAGGALLAVPGVASAHNPPSPPSDVDILSYVLTLERLEATFYRRVLARFSEEEFENAAAFAGLGNYLRRNAYENFQLISEHEKPTWIRLWRSSRSSGAGPCPPANTILA